MQLSFPSEYMQTRPQRSALHLCFLSSFRLLESFLSFFLRDMVKLKKVEDS